MSGVPIKSSTYANSDNSIQSDLASPIFTTTLTQGQYVNVAVSIPTTAWTDSSSFPCPASQYAPDANACDYSVYGSQTVAGKPTVPYSDGGINIPGCCPQGVVYFTPSQPQACNSNIQDSSYTLSLVSVTPSGGSTVVTYSVDYNVSQMGGACGVISIETASIQTNLSPMVAQITSATFAGVNTPYNFGPSAFDGAVGFQISLSGYGSVQMSTPLVITLSGTYAVSDICSVPWYGSLACPYTLVASAASGCCPTSSTS
ncbi:hypothetical protein CEUSTIGMA_g5004.t1 [Chlamydomonas eustigma]|uniref:Uncharacterized protein n=1 Tax=Chlamydomonas eustigma TaxID=1157962 RepID=A0A250X474_9CHLO|nr:hypothetical protein CEUSTIGMA_g5004.t1 [Chlamydomonas eustigma]|eukprot:GAX77560.1 hypothetical protein CEUSTIGMA_g5004.t1 [Chlamydomonas eustigma]